MTSQTPTLTQPVDEPLRFTYASQVHFDELDAQGLLHNSRYAVHAERAVSSFFESQGFRWEAPIEENPDKWHTVGRFEVDYLIPFAGTGPLSVGVWLVHFGRTSATYGFSAIGAQGLQHAHGRRTVVKLDPKTLRPAEWTPAWRDAHLSGLGAPRGPEYLPSV